MHVTLANTGQCIYVSFSLSICTITPEMQDRRKVYSILESEGIEIPRYGVLDRDSPDPKRKYIRVFLHKFLMYM